MARALPYFQPLRNGKSLSAGHHGHRERLRRTRAVFCGWWWWFLVRNLFRMRCAAKNVGSRVLRSFRGVVCLCVCVCGQSWTVTGSTRYGMVDGRVYRHTINRPLRFLCSIINSIHKRCKGAQGHGSRLKSVWAIC